jgi:hypothetical protein
MPVSVRPDTVDERAAASGPGERWFSRQEHVEADATFDWLNLKEE